MAFLGMMCKGQQGSDFCDMKDDFIVDKKKFISRLIVGTGKYKSFNKII